MRDAAADNGLSRQYQSQVRISRSAPVAASNASAPRVVMLASNPCVNDSRIIRSAEAVTASGCEVIVLAPQAKAPAEEVRNGVRYLRLDLPVSEPKGKSMRVVLAHMAGRLKRLALSFNEPLKSFSKSLKSFNRSLKKSLKRLLAKASAALWKLFGWQMWPIKCAVLLISLLSSRISELLWTILYQPELIDYCNRRWLRGRLRIAIFQAWAELLILKAESLRFQTRALALLLIPKVKKFRRQIRALVRSFASWPRRLIRSYRAVAKRLASSLRQRRVAIRGKLIPIFNSTFHTHRQVHRHIALFSDTLAALRPDIVHAHDLATLPAAIESIKQTSGRVIYDAHELETHRNIKTGAIDRWNCRRIEGKYIRKAAGVITVCDSIADYLASTYRIPRPCVVMNAPEEISLNSLSTSAGDLRSDLKLSATSPLAVYVGRITVGRGIEETVEALSHWPELHLALLGTAHPPVLEAATRTARRLGAEDRLHYLQPVAPAHVVSYVATADVSVMAIQNICLSYYYCLPNKLMESVLAGLPIVASDFPELRRFVELSGGGVLMDETDPADIARAMREAYQKRHELKLDDRRRRLTMQSYGWEAQRTKLLALYAELMQGRPTQSEVGITSERAESLRAGSAVGISPGRSLAVENIIPN